MVLYVELLKALYGTTRVAWLFWENLSLQLQEWGFTINAYDNSIAGKTVNEKQLTVAWHVDDLKISHIDVAVVDELIGKLSEEYRKEGPLNISSGKVNDYLGMELDFTKARSVTINMKLHVQTTLFNALENLKGEAATPRVNHLFNAEDETS